MDHEVKIWEEAIIIPTYPTGQPEKNPLFLEKRVYQGSSGVVYPHPVIEKIADEKEDRVYKAVFLENEYIRVMILPQLGGRIQMAYDKIKQRHFIYYNQVIKPALVGLTGPWISGGIEFNWPQHHRPSTFEPVDYTLQENADGSKTVWVNEVERMFRTKGMAGFTLYPGKAYIEIRGRLYNRTPFPQTFLWWANPAVKVNEAYQSVFPPDVYAVFDHGKRDVSSFPIAKGVYYKVDYAPGTDISRYKNIPVPTSYMAIHSKYDFIGGYEHDSQGGLLHVADHHISPGKKQWTWGNGEFGKAWDRNLTDEDGPYIELMTGVFTDNQPDFSWLQPYEEKTFVQYFLPYRDVGLVKNATKEALVNIGLAGNELEAGLYVTAAWSRLEIRICLDEKEFFRETTDSSPHKPWLKKIPLPPGFLSAPNGPGPKSIAGLEPMPADSAPATPEPASAVPTPGLFSITVTDKISGEILVSYQQEPVIQREIPAAARAPQRPEQVENNEQLFLTGLHLEQYRHATYVAADYYKEALKRDEKDARNNNALGLWYLRRGQFAKAEPYFTKAAATLQQRNPNPYDGEPWYNLGWSLKMQGKMEAAKEAFYKAVWNDAWQHAGYLNLARIAVAANKLPAALDLIGKSLLKNYHSHSARHLKAAILRRSGKITAAQECIDESLAIDPFNYGCLFEKVLLEQQSCDQQPPVPALLLLQQRSRGWVHNYIEYALDYAHAGLYGEAAELLYLYQKQLQTQPPTQTATQYPMVSYYLGWFAAQSGNSESALDHFKYASTLSPDYCFPNRIEDVTVLQTAMEMNPADAKAPYYLGNFWYDRRQYDEAIQCWERSVAIDARFPTVHRNLSLAWFNKRQDPARALASMETAFSLDNTDARVLMELDQLYKRLNRAPAERLAFLERHGDGFVSRDDLYLESITLYNQLGEYRKAKELINSYRFHPWEGGEGKVVRQYLLCHLELAKEAIADGLFAVALKWLDAAAHYPDHLGEGKLYGTQENDIHYLKGLAYEGSGDPQAAAGHFLQATEGISEPVQAIFYNDPQPDKIFYQGLAWRRLGENEKADTIFRKLIAFGLEHRNDTIQLDYFAVSLPDLLVFDVDLNERNTIHCTYMMGLGYLGLGQGVAHGGQYLEQAGDFLDEVLRMDANHQAAAVHRQMITHANEIR